MYHIRMILENIKTKKKQQNAPTPKQESVK